MYFDMIIWDQENDQIIVKRGALEHTSFRWQQENESLQAILIFWVGMFKFIWGKKKRRFNKWNWIPEFTIESHATRIA